MNQKVVWSVVAGAVLLICAWLYLSHRAPAPITNYPSAGSDIIAFGDSLVAGSGSTTGHDFVSLLAERLGRPIINLGIPGDTTAQGLARISELDQYHPKVVLLLLGGNDHLKKVPIDTTFANLAAIISAIEARGAIVLLLGVKGSLFGDQFASRFKQMSAEYHTAYVPNVLDGLFGNPQYMADEVHPNDLGYAHITERIYPVLIPLLK